MLRHGGSDLKRLTELRDERLTHTRALQDAEQRAVAHAADELAAQSQVDEERATLREINREIDKLLDRMP
jgi:hypothetical protein